MAAGQMIGPIIGGVFNTIAGAFKSRSDIRANKGINRLMQWDPKYEASPYAQNTLGLAQTLLNSRMAGVGRYEKGIYGNTANQIANINRNATDSSQALALAAGAQGSANDAFGNLQGMESQDYFRKLANLNQANQGMTQEHKDLFDDSVRRWQDQVNNIMRERQWRSEMAQSFANFGAAGQASMSGMNFGK